MDPLAIINGRVDDLVTERPDPCRSRNLPRSTFLIELPVN
jgi:hypothetical protein